MSTNMSAVKSPRDRELARIHIAKKQLGLDDDTYRDMLWTVARVRSAADLDFSGRQAVLHHLSKRGFKARQRSPQKRRGSPQSRLIHHIWNSLADAGVVEHKDALSSWLKANTKTHHPLSEGWSTPELMPKELQGQTIEQLKIWATREKVKWQ